MLTSTRTTRCEWPCWPSVPLRTPSTLKVARSSNYFALRPRWPAQARRADRGGLQVHDGEVLHQSHGRTEPVVGRVIITVEKDRPGYVRGRTDEGGSGSSCSRATRTAR